MRSEMMWNPTDGKKTINVGELMHWFCVLRDLLLESGKVDVNQLEEIGSQ